MNTQRNRAQSYVKLIMYSVLKPYILNSDLMSDFVAGPILVHKALNALRWNL